MNALDRALDLGWLAIYLLAAVGVSGFIGGAVAGYATVVWPWAVWGAP